MLRIRQMQTKDIPFAVKLTDQEQWGVTPDAFQRLIRLNPQGCFIAHDGTKRLALTTTTIYGKQLGWIGNVIVDKDHRGKHVGQNLVRHAISFLQKSSVKHIALYCFKEHVNFYENLGFAKDSGFLRLRRNPRSAKQLKNLVKLRPPSLTRIIALDKEAFGANRSKLIRAVLEEKAGSYLGSLRGISSKSYLMIKEYPGDYEFGPWICLDPLRDQPEEMISRALAIIRSVPVEISCLQKNRRALQTLKTNGFRMIRKGYRMFFEEKTRIGDDSSQYALGFLDKG